MNTNNENENNKGNSSSGAEDSSTMDYWKQTLKEIKSLSVPFDSYTFSSMINGTTSTTSSSTSSSNDDNDNVTDNSALNKRKINLSRWKMINSLSNTNSPTTSSSSTSTSTSTSSGSKTPKLQRFDGFGSWEKILQSWSEDIQEYIEQTQIDQSKNQYLFSTAGKPSSTSTNTTATKMNTTTEPETEVPSSLSLVSEQEKKQEEIENDKVNNNKKLLPIPQPRKNNEPVLDYTDLSDVSKNIWVVTTAALPWMTGTAVNPLLRAAYLLKKGKQKSGGGSITLMLPWLERVEDQERVYGKDKVFNTPADQELYIRNWLKKTANMELESEQLNIRWYTAWQNKAENSVYSMGDITAEIPSEEVDIIILEEPEHMNWYRAPGDNWTTKYKHVIGIIHTNYFVYAQEQPAAFIRAPAMKQLCIWMCRSHCHRIIKLSGALQQFAPEKELIENVHGVRGSFLETGRKIKEILLYRNKNKYNTNNNEDDKYEYANAATSSSSKSVYFIGKMLWSKGLGPLMELLKYAEESAGLKLKVDMYGGGPDKDAAESKSKTMGLNMVFHGPVDHADLSFTQKVFINPSTSEVLCTTVSEALAMGKFVVLPSHPSNDFFAQFPNCLTYSSKEEFVGNLYYALTHSPEPLADEYLYALSWEAATERLELAGCIPVKEAELMAEAGGVEITLPALIENPKSKELVSARIERSRERYRQFRSRLSQEIAQTTVLPKFLKNRLVAELDKRLDLDIVEMLESPKLRLKLSPAELDKQLLDLYNGVAAGPSGDILRFIGGGNEVSMQVLYMKRQERKRKGKTASASSSYAIPEFFDYLSEEGRLAADGSDNRAPYGTDYFYYDEEKQRVRTPSLWVKRALRRNLPKVPSSTQLQELDSTDSSSTGNNTKSDTLLMTAPSKSKTTTPSANKQKWHRRETPKMSIQQNQYQNHFKFPSSKVQSLTESWNGGLRRLPSCSFAQKSGIHDGASFNGKKFQASLNACYGGQTRSGMTLLI